MSPTVLIDPIDVVTLPDLLIHFLKLLHHLIPLSTSHFFELLNNRAVNLQKRGLLEVEFQGNFFIEVRQPSIKLLTFELSLEDKSRGVESLLYLMACCFL